MYALYNATSFSLRPRGDAKGERAASGLLRRGDAIMRTSRQSVSLRSGSPSRNQRVQAPTKFFLLELGILFLLFTFYLLKARYPPWRGIQN
jgi:hypothetical protein